MIVAIFSMPLLYVIMLWFIFRRGSKKGYDVLFLTNTINYYETLKTAIGLSKGSSLFKKIIIKRIDKKINKFCKRKNAGEVGSFFIAHDKDYK